ncbi:hypothetical protein N431DRAFT_157487 [Stipitochalara longipes BDJ]|nr:hypothetical protein N431DRAFT_157487 [Stipitochalara longipes BDJ]
MSCEDHKHDSESCKTRRAQRPRRGSYVRSRGAGAPRNFNFARPSQRSQASVVAVITHCTAPPALGPVSRRRLHLARVQCSNTGSQAHRLTALPQASLIHITHHRSQLSVDPYRTAPHRIASHRSSPPDPQCSASHPSILFFSSWSFSLQRSHCAPTGPISSVPCLMSGPPGPSLPAYACITSKLPLR